MDKTIIIGISAVSGGGKTGVTKRLVELLGDAIAVHWDDYGDTTIEPQDFQAWRRRGGNYDEWDAPVLAENLEALKSGSHIRSVVDNSILHRHKYVVFDAPLGRRHAQTGPLIDYMVFIETPLDIALARRTLRDHERGLTSSADQILTNLKSYLAGERPLYVEMASDIGPTCDLVVRGDHSINDVAAEILVAVRRFKR